MQAQSHSHRRRAVRFGTLLLGGAVLAASFVAALGGPSTTTRPPAVDGSPVERPAALRPFDETAARVRATLGSMRGEMASKLAASWVSASLASNAEETQEAVRLALDDPDPDLRWLAALALEHCGEIDAPLARLWLSRTTDEAPHVRTAALASFERVTGVGVGTAELLMDVERAAEPALRAAIIGCLARTTPADADHAWLLDRLGDPHEVVRRQAAAALAAATAPPGGASEHLVARVAQVLSSGDAHTRACAARALERLGTAAAPAADALAEHLADDDRQTSRWAGLALLACGPSAIPALTRALGDHARASAAASLLKLIGGPLAKQALHDGLHHADPEVRVACASTLAAEIDLDAVLRPMLEGHTPAVTVAVLECFTLKGEISPDTERVVRALLRSPDAAVRLAARDVLDTTARRSR